MKLEGRVAIITGAGRGIGREHALLFAREGARVVVNDFGGRADGTGDDPTPAQAVVDEIVASGGQAVANTDSVSSWSGAQRLVEQAVDVFGGLDVLVNNAGFLRDSTLVNMTEEAWDSVVEVHLKGHFAPLHWAANYWRKEAKADRTRNASVVNTCSGSGLFGNPGQANYAAAKSGIAGLTLVAARELERYGVRVNALVPVARTRLTEQTPGVAALVSAPADSAQFDQWHPGHVSPLVAYLATASCQLTGQVLGAHGGSVTLFSGWAPAERVDQERRWTVGELEAALTSFPVGLPAMQTSA